ncbi:hypothetical protein HDU98_002192 [Podochytrium sp. JEL0797]|nr:hypothetical protein HDU98_002192 [Podochytrium sp. JEL0797]
MFSFGNTQQPTQQPQGSAGASLFGQTQPQNTQGGGLFGGGGSSLFGGASTQPQQQNTQGALFGGQQQQQQQQQAPAPTIDGTTRYGELPLNVRTELDNFENFVQKQIELSEEIAGSGFTKRISASKDEIKNIQLKYQGLKTLLDRDETLIKNLRELVGKEMKTAAIAEILKHQHESFLLIAGKIAAVHDAFSKQRDAFLAYRKKYFGDNKNPFRKGYVGQDDRIALSTIAAGLKPSDMSASTATAPAAAAAPAATGGLFGGSAAPATGGGLFGAPAAAAPATGGFGGFGTPAAAAPATGGFGGFGTPAAAAPATGGFGGFGTPAAAAAPATGGFGGFGTPAAAAPATGGFGGFGTPAAAAPATGGFGGFGAPAAGGGLFGGAVQTPSVKKKR